ncbi:alpha/beta hydrolase [Lewinella sp. W8]|uniref:alpha/beta hydrolase n=1 Tax=Lewinella sp. W8 TaxID=2528208 RepID=UPI0010688F05|nr:alpha/beta hydrolase-fold protein [Lewinella sp. W8]MTB52451.1 alpha/beta hydrolase [Lewinella sp. W8]
MFRLPSSFYSLAAELSPTPFFLATALAFLFLSCSTEPPPRPPAPRPSTLQPNVTILENPLPMPGLDRDRQIRIYLPPDYVESDDRYPVLYMHDGQNLFDDSTSFVGEWGVDEMLNEMAEESDFRLIVVGVDNGQELRMRELSPWVNEDYGPAEGEAYLEFIVRTVKPLVDATYRTQTGPAYTAIMGSSMGGLISHYGVYAYPEVFGRAGIFSPSYWYSDSVFTFTRDFPVPDSTRLYLTVGRGEGEMVDYAERMEQTIRKTGHPDDNLVLTVDPQGEHNEAFWNRQFMPAVRWLFELE